MKRVIIVMMLPLWFYSASSVQAVSWRGIVPLKSTCREVKSALNVDKCNTPMSEYDLPDLKIIVFFSENKKCTSLEDWRVAPGIVTGLIILPKRKLLPSEFGINISKFVEVKEHDVVGIKVYENRKEGIKVNLFNGFVSEARFYPSAKDTGRRCKQGR